MFSSGTPAPWNGTTEAIVPRVPRANFHVALGEPGVIAGGPSVSEPGPFCCEGLLIRLCASLFLFFFCAFSVGAFRAFFKAIGALR
jgi:hypothetical protein